VERVSNRHWDQIVASDFFTIEVWDAERFAALYRALLHRIIDATSREIGAIASKANGLWLAQIARNVTEDVDGYFKGQALFES
jgi:hypothetical protein